MSILQNHYLSVICGTSVHANIVVTGVSSDRVISHRMLNSYNPWFPISKLILYDDIDGYNKLSRSLNTLLMSFLEGEFIYGAIVTIPKKHHGKSGVISLVSHHLRGS
jgi:hypothetical protein